jgi:hypothetical protein
MNSTREFNYSKRPIPMNTSNKLNGVAGEINKAAPPDRGSRWTTARRSRLSW